MGEKAMAKAAEEDWHVGESVVALIESRAREIGLAAVHRRSMQFEITQFSDTASYNRVVSHCLFQDPARVLVSRSARGTQLLLLLEQAFPERLLCLERRHFDEARGQALLQETCVSGLQAPDLEEKFVASAAFAALWHFLEASNMHLQIPAVLVRFRVASHSMVIDGSTARRLELVRGASEPAKSLLGLFACRTAGGQHLLRQSLLQPSVQLPEIQARQQAVESLLRDESLFFQLQQLLPALGDLDVLLARLSEPSGSLGSGSDGCKVAVRTALRLRNVLAALPLLADVLEAAPKEGLLEELRTLLGHRRFSELCKELDRVLDSEGFSQRSQRGSMAHCALMYAVKSNVSALLDVARQTWSESMAKIQSTFRVLAAKYPDLRLRLEFAEKRGWFLSHEAMGIPEAFLHTSLKKNSKGQRSQRAESTTKDLNQENFKLRQAEAEILKRTAEALGGLLHELRSEATLLHRASQAAAVLDLIAAFAGYALSASCVRPEMRDAPEAPIAVKAGRHPLLDRLGDFEPVDFYMDGTCHFQTITGRNGGGKSTYLATMAQLVILAHIGSYVPARSASFRVVTALFTRMGTSDSIEANASSFLVEMRETSHLLKNLTSRSLVLVDELGRGTAHADGLAICRAVSERLLDLKVYTFFATHFFEICWGLAPLNGFRSMHLEQIEDSKDGLQRTRFCVQHVASMKALHEKAEEHYGLRAAEHLGLPQTLVRRGEDMAVQVHALLGHREESADAAATAQQLLVLARRSLAPGALREVLRQIRKPWSLHSSS